MIPRNFEPHPSLQSFVSRIMLFHYQIDRSKPRPLNPFPPHPEQSLYFYPFDRALCHNYANNSTEEIPRSIIVGPQLSRVDLTMGYNMLVVYIGFHPGGLYRMLGIPMNEMVDQYYDSSSVLGKEMDTITEQIALAATYEDMIDHVQRFLVQKATRLRKISLPLDKVLARQMKSERMVNVDQLSDHACLSVRQLERQFNERIGMPPKLFSRLVRFSRAWYLRETNTQLTWSEIAYACHYADQMHMIRDFKNFVGSTPGSLQNELNKSPLRLRADLGN